MIQPYLCKKVCKTKKKTKCVWCLLSNFEATICANMCFSCIPAVTVCLFGFFFYVCQPPSASAFSFPDNSNASLWQIPNSLEHPHFQSGSLDCVQILKSHIHRAESCTLNKWLHLNWKLKNTCNWKINCWRHVMFFFTCLFVVKRMIIYYYFPKSVIGLHIRMIRQ